MSLDVLSTKQETLLNKESPTFKNVRVGTGLRLAQIAINANEAHIGDIAGVGRTTETVKDNADAIGALTALADKRVSIGIAAGTNIDVVNIADFDPEITSIVAILAFKTADGSAAAKFLLAETTDYTFADGALTTVTDQSANTLIVFYK